MIFHYDSEDDRLRVVFTDRPVASGDEPVPDFHFYYDADGKVVGFDIDEASRHVADRRRMEFSSDD